MSPSDSGLFTSFVSIGSDDYKPRLSLLEALSISMELARVTLIFFEDDYSLEVNTNCGLLFFLSFCRLP